MSNSGSGDFLAGLAAISLVAFVLSVVMVWVFSYTLPYAQWKCVEEVQVGEDITNHQCIAYRRKDYIK